MLVKRLEAVGPLSWMEVCACLRSPTVDRNDVAEKIEEWEKGTQPCSTCIVHIYTPIYTTTFLQL